jgi:hypothetical protein
MAADVFLRALEASAPVAAIEQSFWLYPLISALHILGIALLVGPTIIFDVQVLRRRQGPTNPDLHAALWRWATAGLALAATTGALLFAVRATEYAENPAMGVKLATLAILVINAAWALRLRALGDSRFRRLAAALSLIGWPTVLMAGRAIGFVA